MTAAGVGATQDGLAPAKINLSLHVTGRRADGYHTLDSLVVFAGEDCADRVSLSAARDDRFDMTGPFTPSLQAADGNLVIKARDWLRARADGRPAPPVHLTLHKALPVASGIGGGSADAAAALRLLAAHWGFGRDWLAAHATAIAAELGADVPMCVAGNAARATGVGERLEPVTGLPALPVVLVNPGVAIATPAAFAGLTRRNNPPMPDVPAQGFADAAALAQWLDTETRNDLEQPARAIVPVVTDVLDALDGSGALLVRMSGSGATCFGLFDTMEAARQAANHLARPGWWVRATWLNAATRATAKQEALADG